MKSKCSFILKAGTSLVLALLMLFGTVATSIAAVVDHAEVGAAADVADTGAQADLAETGFSNTSAYFKGDFGDSWASHTVNSDGDAYIDKTKSGSVDFLYTRSSNYDMGYCNWISGSTATASATDTQYYAHYGDGYKSNISCSLDVGTYRFHITGGGESSDDYVGYKIYSVTKYPASTKFYLNTDNYDWADDDARIYAFFCNSAKSGESSTWLPATACPGNDGYYYVTTPENSKYTTLIWVRLDNSTAESFDNKWNQTGNLSYESGKYMTTLTDWNAGTQSNSTHTHTVTIMGKGRDYAGATISNLTSANSSGTPDWTTTATYNPADYKVATAPSGYTYTGMYTDAACTTTAGTSISNTGDATYYALYTHNNVDVTFKNASGTGGTVSRGGSQIVSSLTTSGTAVSTDYNRSLSYTIAPADGYKIDSVSGGGTWTIAADGSSATCSFAVTDATTVTVTQSLSTLPSLDEIDNVSKTVNDTTFNVSATVEHYAEASGTLSATASSDTTSVATVGTPTYSSGTVTIPVTVKGPGSSTVTVTLNDGSTTMNSRTFTVSVAEPTFAIANKTITAEASGVAACTVTNGGIAPSSITWSSGTTANVAVNASTGALTAKKINSSSTITATATYACGYTKSATATVTVANPTLTIQSTKTSGYIGDTATASVNTATNPSLSSATVASYLWSTSDSTIIGISDPSAESPTLTFKKPGTATIKLSVTYKNNNLSKESATVSITVKTPVISSFSYSPSTIYTGATYYTASPTKAMDTSTYDSTNSTVVYSYAVTSGSDYGTVNASTGVVTPKSSAGTVTVTLSATVTNNECSYTATKTADVTVAEHSGVYINYGIGDTGTSKQMEYDETASQAKNSVVYKATIANLSKNTTYRIRPYDGNDKYSDTNITANTPFSGSGISLITGDASNYFTMKTRTASASSAGTYVFYYDVINEKFYVEYPVQVTYNANGHGSTTYEMVEYGGKATTKTPSVTGYTFGGWYNESGCSTMYDFETALIADKTIYAKWTVKSHTFTLTPVSRTSSSANYAADNTASLASALTASGSTASGTKNYGTAITLNDPTAPAGYRFIGFKTSLDGTGDPESSMPDNDYTVYACFERGVNVTFKESAAFSSTTIQDPTFTYYGAVPAAPSDPSHNGYTFNGWSSDGGTTTVTTANLPAISGASDITYVAQYTKTDFSASGSVMVTTDGSTYTTSSVAGTLAITNTDGTAIASPTTMTYGDKIKLVATENPGYKLVGIYRVRTGGSEETVTTAAGTATVDGTTVATATCSEYELNTTAEPAYVFEARFKKVYHLSLYNTWIDVGTNGIENWRFVSAPPMKVTATSLNGDVVTYTYKKNAASIAEGETRTGTSNYNEGDLLTVYAGDTVVLNYSALASSDTITGIFFNNEIKYTTEGQPDNLYLNRVEQTSDTAEYKDPEHPEKGFKDGDDDWDYTYLPATTLYADPDYYTGTTVSTINDNKANYQAKDGVDNHNHTVTFTVKSDYLNIDLEIATKRQFIFTDETGLDIRSENIDNYYDPLDAVSASTATTKFGIKLATSDTCTYDWGTGDKVKFYRDAACTTEITDVFTVASTADTSGYFVISGTMPNYDVYVKPNVITKYNLYLGGRIVADSFNSYDSFGDVANYYVKDAAGTTTLLTGRDDTTNTAASAVEAGSSVTLTYTFSGDNGSLYSFIGWYKGDATGPDYANGKISTKNPFTYIPKANTYIYAVGTRDVYINGSANITGASTDWYSVNSVKQNFLMDFDPDYVNPDGGAIGRYYWVVEPEWFAASGTGGVGNFVIGDYQSESTPYWNDNSNTGSNSFFQFYDQATGDDKSIWSGINPFISTKDYIKFAKIDPRDYTGDEVYHRTDGLGTIKFKESDYNGYTAPITIYYYPGHGFSVEPTPMFSNLYVSNGFTVGGTTNNTDDTSVTPATGETFTVTTSGDGWPTNIDDKAYVEGTVMHYIPEKKNAKVKISKTVSSTEKVVAFDIYDLDNDKVYSRTDVTADGNAYSIELQVTMQQNLYIIPIIQENSADLTINFDGTQLNKTQWGDVVSCYAWYGNGKHNGTNNFDALGAYPGQPMVVSDDGNTWTATIPAEKTIGGTKYTLTGILFANFVDGERSWLGRSGVMGTVSDHSTATADGGLINLYNHIDSGNGNDYARTNFKAQTYDYREPVAIYKNEEHAEGVETTITFAMKDGDSSLISWHHSELLSENILTGTWGSTLRWEYLTNSTGKKYADLNGRAMDNKPSASFYIAAKGQVIYENGVMTNVFYGGKGSDTPSPTVSYDPNDVLEIDPVNFNYAVQWYVYDAQGNYITNVLSAAYADKVDDMSYIAKQLDDLGYPVDGRSVAICYDKPRYMYTDDGGVINSGANFEVYRFEGQWYTTVKTEPVTVSVGVGMMTENGEVIAATNHPGYGDAYATYDTTYGTASSYFTPTSDGDTSVTIALADASKRLIKLRANPTNFIGWYYYDANTKEFTKASYESPDDFYPNFNADVTYYAMYEARAVYQYKYAGREGAKVYSVSGGAMTDAEMTASNKVSKDRTDFGTKSPTISDVSIFKKDVSFNTTVTPNMLNNDTEYIMNISNATISDASYTVTAHFKDDNGSPSTKAKTAVYNTPVDFTDENEGTALTSAYANTGHRFIGWYECDSTGKLTSPNMLLSTQANYGMVVVKDQHILAVYEGDGNNITVSADNAFTLFVDDHEITREKYSADSGTYYNDTIIRLRNNSTGNLTSLPGGAEVGILVINANDSGQSTTAGTESLTRFASNMKSGDTYTVGTQGRTVTKVSTTSLNRFGRVDLATRADYTTVDGKAYSVYAYYKNPSGEYTFVTVRESGTYTAG